MHNATWRWQPRAIACLGSVAMICGVAGAGGPANDDCANAIPVGEGNASGTTIGASNDAPGICGNSDTSPDVWYRYNADEDGLLQVQTCGGAGWDTVLAIWTECPVQGGTAIGCNDDACAFQSSVTGAVTAGEDYYIRVAGFNGASGAFTMNVSHSPIVQGDGPDVVYSDCLSLTNWGVTGGIRAYSLDSYTCNIGDMDLAWGGNTPLLAMNAYRLANGRLEQIGMSFVKNGTTAAAGSGCGFPCNGNGGAELGSGCRDVYGSGFNGSQGILGPRSAVNAFTGAYPGASGGSGGATYKRLQIAEADLSVPGALYFIEGQYVAWDDALWGNAMNNASYKRATVGAAPYNITPVGVMEVGTPAIHAWHDHGNGAGVPDNTVHIVEVDVPDEGRFHVASKVRDLGGGSWRYEYAVRNLNSHRSAGSFSVPVGAGATVSNIGFHDVNYHSGEPYDNTDWSGSASTGTAVTWSSPQTFAQNQNTNALRFGTMYNFWFDATVAPADGEATIGLFRPGTPESVTAAVSVPGQGTEPCPADVNGDGEVDVQDIVEVIIDFGPCAACPADVDGDGDVDVQDLVSVILGWGPC